MSRWYDQGRQHAARRNPGCALATRTMFRSREPVAEVPAEAPLLHRMAHDRVRGVTRGPPGVDDPPAGGGILEVEGQDLVEAPGRLEGLAPEEQVAAFEERRLAVDVPVHEPLTVQIARWPGGAALHHAQVRIAWIARQPGLEPTGLGRAVVVGERYERRLSRRATRRCARPPVPVRP